MTGTMGSRRRVVITGGLVVDGNGAPARPADVAIIGNRVTDVVPPGAFGTVGADQVEDATGLVVCPGFIDAHSHADEAPLRARDDTSKVLQGVTTEVVGNCGESPDPASHGGFRGLYEHLDDAGYVTNYCPLVGHGMLRESVMGMSRRASSASESRQMSRMLEEALDAGAWGMSSGLMYAPGVFSEVDEMVDLVRHLPEGRVYATHMRDEGRHLRRSVSEALEVARRADVKLQISHLKASGVPHWGTVESALAQIDDARRDGVDVSQDVYPYDACSTTLLACMPPWFLEGGREAVMQRLRDPDCLIRARREIETWEDDTWENVVAADGYDRVHVAATANREDEGRSLVELAEVHDIEPFEVLVDVLRKNALDVTIVDFAMDEGDVLRVLRHPFTSVGTDGGTGLPEGDPHPRVHGSFPRVLGRYVREQRALAVEDAVHKMTGRTADAFGLRDRGRLEPGSVADVVLFDPDVVSDRGTYVHPHVAPLGIRMVLQGGAVVVRDGTWLGTRRGKRLAPDR